MKILLTGQDVELMWLNSFIWLSLVKIRKSPREKTEQKITSFYRVLIANIKFHKLLKSSAEFGNVNYIGLS